MEIIEYLRIAKRRWWILVGVPVLAAAAVVALVLLSPAQYTATATVNSGALVGAEGSPFSGTQAAPQFVAAFQAAAVNPAVQDAVSKATGVSTDDLAGDVTVKAVGTSSDVQVTYAGPSSAQAQQVPAQIARRSLELIFSSRATAATATRDQAQAAVTQANAALSALSQKYKVADPPRAYQTALGQVATLQQQQAQLRASGSATGAAAMDAPIATAQATLSSYLPILAEYNNLAATQSATQQDLAVAQNTYRQAVSLRSVAEGDAVVYVGSSSPVSPVSTLVSTGVPVVGAAVLLGIILVVLLEFFARVRAAAREERAAEAEGAAPTGRHAARQATRRTEADPANV